MPRPLLRRATARARSTLDDLAARVEANGGVITTTAEALRDMYGSERLGVHVRAAISKELAGRGLAHFPLELPDRQHEFVRVYRQGSPVAEIIKYVLDVDPKNDAKLRKLASGDSERIVTKIRELLDDEV